MVVGVAVAERVLVPVEVAEWVLVPVEVGVEVAVVWEHTEPSRAATISSVQRAQENAMVVGVSAGGGGGGGGGG